MAEGNPRLAVWESGGVVRVFEFTAGAFVQLAALGGFQHNPGAFPEADFAPPPRLSWMYDGKFLMVARNTSATASRFTTLDDFLAPVDVESNGDTNGSLRQGVYVTNLRDSAVYFVGNAVQYNNVNMVSPTGDIVNKPYGSPQVSIGDSIRCAEISPDAETFFVGRRKPEQSCIFKRGGEFNGARFYEQQPIFITSRSAHCAGWSPDSQYLLTGDQTNGVVQVHKRAADTLSVQLVHELPLEPGFVPVTIKASPDRRWLAVGWRGSGPSYKTVMYRRSGDFYSKKQTFTGMGQMVSFSGDGRLLADGAQRMALSFNGIEWSVLAGAMNNIPLGMTVQAMSPHLVNPIGLAQIYNGVIDQIIDEEVDLSNLKLTLLKAGAAFNPAHTTLAQVTAGGLEVDTGGWPIGGLKLNNVQKVDAGNVVNIKADPLYRIVVGSPLTARYAVVYDDTQAGDRPLVFVDLLVEKLTARNAEMVLSFRSNNLLTFGS